MHVFFSILFLQPSKTKESQSADTTDATKGLNNSATSDDKKPSKKKRVSFKFALETNEDAHIVKKEPNATFAPPVSIIKKECLTRAIRIARGGEPIIMPSRLTGLTQKLRHNNANNIDKLNSLTFKSQFVNKSNSDDDRTSSNDDSADIDDFGKKSLQFLKMDFKNKIK